MHSAARAIAMTFWLRHWRMLSGVALLLALAACISSLFGTPRSDPREVGAVITQVAMPFVLAAGYLVTTFAYASEAHIESRGSCFPYRMFTLPVRTAALVFWPMLYGAGALALLWL